MLREESDITERLFFVKQFLGYNKVKRKVQRFLTNPLVSHMHSLVHYQHPLLGWYMGYN